MSETITKDNVIRHIAALNAKFNIELNPEDFKSSDYSLSSIRDILIQKVQDEVNGEWTADIAFHKIKKATVKITGIAPEKLTADSPLNDIFPADKRKDNIKSLSESLGTELDVLKPNSAIYGTLIFLFFACIPLAIGMSWFFSGIAMIVIALLIYIMGKTGNQFKMKTLGQMADVIAWKNYLTQKQGKGKFTEEQIRSEIEAIIK